MLMYNTNWKALSDTAIAAKIGAFIKHRRLMENKTQKTLATEAGVGLRTLSNIEAGGLNMNVLTLIQLMRALNCLNLMDIFTIEPQISPMMLAEQEMKYRKRARKSNKSSNKPTSDW